MKKRISKHAQNERAPSKIKVADPVGLACVCIEECRKRGRTFAEIAKDLEFTWKPSGKQATGNELKSWYEKQIGGRTSKLKGASHELD